jgi:hypothetical protein
MADIEVSTVKEGAALLLGAILAGIILALYYAYMSKTVPA